MRKILSVLVAATALSASMLVALAAPAAAADPLSAECSDASLLTVNGINAPSCTTAVVECSPESAGCALSAFLEMRAATGVGASRCVLRLRNADTGERVDFFSSGPATHCFPLQLTAFQPAGSRFTATCAATKDNVLVRPRVSCAIGFEPLG